MVPPNCGSEERRWVESPKEHFLSGRNLPEATDRGGGRKEAFIQLMQEASKVISPQDPARAASIVTGSCVDCPQ